MYRRDLAKALFVTAAGSGLNPPLAEARGYEQTAAEVAAGVTPVHLAHPPGVVDRYGENTKPGETEMSGAVRQALRTSGEVTFLNATYLIANLSIERPATFRGQGFATILLATTAIAERTRYSQNMFTATRQLDYITFEDLTLDGGCDNANRGHVSEISLVKIINTSRVTFRNVKLTRYCGGWDGVSKAVSASFWQAITIHNATRCAFLNCLLADNHYEMVLIWNGPKSDGEVLVDGCTEVNTGGTPDSHTAFDIHGGHITVTNCTFRNTGSSSCLTVEVPKSVRVAHNVFLDPQPGAAAQIHIGQDIFPYNTRVVIEGNYCRNANQAAISVGQGSDIIIRDNIIDTPGSYGIKLTAGLRDFALFRTEYPEWPVPMPAGSNSITIAGNIINGVADSAGISKAIYLHIVTSNAGYWFKDVRITDNTITAGPPPHDTYWAVVLHDIQNAVIRGNRMQYTKNGIHFVTLTENVRVEENTFRSVPPLAASDIIWTGDYTSRNASIRNNRFENIPVGPNPTVHVFAGKLTGLAVIDNDGISPTRPVGSKDSTAYVAYQTVKRRVTRAPDEGDWGINDVVRSVPTPGMPGEYICISAGSFGPPLTCAATGAAMTNSFTCSDIGQMRVGMHFSVTGAGAGGADLPCTCTCILESRIYIDQVISRSVSGAAMTLINPTFTKSADLV